MNNDSPFVVIQRIKFRHVGRGQRGTLEGGDQIDIDRAAKFVETKRFSASVNCPVINLGRCRQINDDANLAKVAKYLSKACVDTLRLVRINSVEAAADFICGILARRFIKAQQCNLAIVVPKPLCRCYTHHRRRADNDGILAPKLHG